MAEAHPLALRLRVVRAYLDGEGSYRDVALEFSVGEASVKRWVRQYEDEGHLEPRPKQGGRRSDIEPTTLEAIVGRLRDANADEITAEYNRGRPRGQRRHVSSIKRALHRFGYVVKKSASGRWSSSART